MFRQTLCVITGFFDVAVSYGRLLYTRTGPRVPMSYSPRFDPLHPLVLHLLLTFPPRPPGPLHRRQSGDSSDADVPLPGGATTALHSHRLYIRSPVCILPVSVGPWEPQPVSRAVHCANKRVRSGVVELHSALPTLRIQLLDLAIPMVGGLRQQRREPH